jgi:hypothetical protein
MNMESQYLIGAWSHGVANSSQNGSHDFRLILLPDGRGSFWHDGWWRYRYFSFRWQFQNDRLQLHDQQLIVQDWDAGTGKLDLNNAPLNLVFDSKLNRECLIIPFINEPNEYWLLTREPQKLEHMYENT